MEQAKIRAIQYRYNNILERYEMLAIEGEKSMIGQIIDDVPWKDIQKELLDLNMKNL